MIRRIERDAPAPLRRLGVTRRADGLVPVVEGREAPELALRYGNGFVTVEVSFDAVDRYVEAYGDVPLPIRVDPETGDRRAYDRKTKVRVVYDRDARLREVTTRGRDGVFVRVNIVPDPPAPEPEPQAAPAAALADDLVAPLLERPAFVL